MYKIKSNHYHFLFNFIEYVSCTMQINFIDCEIKLIEIRTAKILHKEQMNLKSILIYGTLIINVTLQRFNDIVKFIIRHSINKCYTGNNYVYYLIYNEKRNIKLSFSDHTMKEYLQYKNY